VNDRTIRNRSGSAHVPGCQSADGASTLSQMARLSADAREPSAAAAR
jgi:hypothetical protein